MPLFSIIVTLHNTGQLVNHPLECFRQLDNGEGEFEFVFIDDGSRQGDPALPIVRNFIAQNPSARLLSFENAGIGIARNRGVREARGKWIVFLDGDDYLQPGLFSVFKKVHAKVDANVYTCKFRCVGKDEIYKPSLPTLSWSLVTQEEANKNFLIRKNVFLVPGTILKRDFLVKEDVWHENLRWSEDQHFVWKMLSKAESLVMMSYLGYNYLQNVSGSIMASTSLDRFSDSLTKMEALAKISKYEKVRRFLAPRWLLGCYHVLAKRNEKDSYLAFLEQTDARAVFRELTHFPSFKVRVVGAVGLLSPNLLFWLLRSRR